MTKNKSIAGNSLSKCYTTKALFGPSEVFWALKDISFSVMEGETLCILGESGSGKSTLAKLLVGAIEPTSGKLIIDDKDVATLSELKQKQRHSRVRMVYQNTLASLNPSRTIGEILLEPLINMTSLNKKERQEKLKQVLDLVGLKWEYTNRLPHSFSAGERQKIAIARALMLDPVCIIADEPLSSLETSAQSQIINLMLDLQEDLGLSFIIITYNIDVIKHMCDKVLVLCRGRQVEYGETNEVINNPKHPYTRQFLDTSTNKPRAATDSDNDANMPGCVFCDRCEDVSERCYKNQPEEAVIGDRLIYCHQYSDHNQETVTE